MREIQIAQLKIPDYWDVEKHGGFPMMEFFDFIEKIRKSDRNVTNYTARISEDLIGPPGRSSIVITVQSALTEEESIEYELELLKKKEEELNKQLEELRG